MTTLISHEKVDLHKLLWVGPLTIVVAVSANLLIRSIAVTFFGVSTAFQLLQASSIIGSTIVFLLLALLAFVLVSRFARRPLLFYRWLALICLCVSLLTPVMALLGLFPAPHMSVAIFWTMIVMHVVSAIIVIGLLTTLTRAKQSER